MLDIGITGTSVWVVPRVRCNVVQGQGSATLRVSTMIMGSARVY